MRSAYSSALATSKIASAEAISSYGTPIRRIDASLFRFTSHSPRALYAHSFAKLA